MQDRGASPNGKLRVRTQTLEPEPVNTGVGSRYSLAACRPSTNTTGGRTLFTTRQLMTGVTAMSLLALTACTASTPEEPMSAPAAQEATQEVAENIVVLSHDSFEFPKELLDKFEKENGIKVTIHAVGDGGTLANTLVLAKDAPEGDVVYGVDNTVSYRLVGQNIIENASITSPDTTLDYTAEPGLVPIDHGDVCVNLDKEWFTAHNLAYPATFEDLAKPEYKDKLVAMNPATSTPGMAFMLATINHFGEDGWIDYWKSLKDNGVKVTEGWSDAFNVDYSSGEGKGSYPMMVSYGSSPAYFVNEAKTDTTNAALPATCYRQVEYAGVLKGSQHMNASKKFIEFMLTPEVQEAISGFTYMYPASKDAKAPEDLVKFGPLSPAPVMIPADKVAQHAEEWLKAWQGAVIG